MGLLLCTMAQNSTAKSREPLAVSVPEAAHLLGISERYAWKLVKTGDLPTSLIGGRRIVPVAALHRLLEENRVEAS